MSLCCTVGYKWVTVMDGIKVELNDIMISLYTKKNSERRRFASPEYYILYTLYCYSLINPYYLFRTLASKFN